MSVLPEEEDDSTFLARLDKQIGYKTTPKKVNSRTDALRKAADALGVDAADLGAIISFESAGTFNPHKVGGEGGKYKGLIQFGPDEQRKYYRPDDTFETQLEKGVVPYFRDRFKKAGRDTQGASLEDLYTTVIAGNPGANRNAKDSFGTSAKSGTRQILKEHRPKVLKNFFGGQDTQENESDFLARIDNLIAQPVDEDDDTFLSRIDQLIQTPIGEKPLQAPGQPLAADPLAPVVAPPEVAVVGDRLGVTTPTFAVPTPVQSGIQDLPPSQQVPGFAEEIIDPIDELQSGEATGNAVRPQANVPALATPEKRNYTEPDFKAWADYKKLPQTPETRKTFEGELASSGAGKVNVSAEVQPPAQPSVSEDIHAATSVPTKWKGGNKPLSDDELLQSKINFKVNLTGLPMAERTKYATESVRKNLIAQGLAPEQAAEFNLTSPITENDADVLTVNALRSDIAAIAGKEWVRAKYDEERADPTLQLAQATDAANAKQSVVPTGIPQPSLANESESEEELKAKARAEAGEVSILNPDDWKVFLGKMLDDPSAIWTGKPPDITPEDREAARRSAIKDIIKQAGSASEALKLKKEYESLSTIDKGVLHAGDFASTVLRAPAMFARTIAWAEDAAGYLREKGVPITITSTDVINAVDWMVHKAAGTKAKPQEQGLLPNIYASAIDNAFPDDKRTANTFAGKIARGAGSAVPFLLGAVASGGSTPIIALLGAGQEVGSMYKQAKDAKLSREKQLLSGLMGIPIGLSEIWGLKWAKLGEMINNRSKGALLTSFANWLTETGKSATEEALQEYFQSTAGKLVMTGLKNDGLSKKDIANALGESIDDAFTAAVVGTLFGGGTPVVTSGVAKLEGRKPGFVDTRIAEVEVEPQGGADKDKSSPPSPTPLAAAPTVIAPVEKKVFETPKAEAEVTEKSADITDKPVPPKSQVVDQSDEQAKVGAESEKVAPSGRVPALKDVRSPSSTALYNAASGTFDGETKSENTTVDINTLTGGVQRQDFEQKRVDKLVKQIQSDDGYIERLIVDGNGDVIEGQHRLEALRQLGIKDVPVVRITELRDAIPDADAVVKKLASQVKLHREQVRGLVDEAARIVDSEGMDALKEYEAPQGFAKEWDELLKILQPQTKEKEIAPTESKRPNSTVRGQDKTPSPLRQRAVREASNLFGVSAKKSKSSGQVIDQSDVEGQVGEQLEVVTPPSSSAAKEPWQMTAKEWKDLPMSERSAIHGPNNQGGANPSHSNYHSIRVITAVSKGENVPRAVMDEIEHASYQGGKILEDVAEGKTFPVETVKWAKANVSKQEQARILKAAKRTALKTAKESKLAARREDGLLKVPDRKVTRTPEFRKFFKGSKVIDEKGEPKRLYHARRMGPDFGSFDIENSDLGAHFGELNAANPLTGYYGPKMDPKYHTRDYMGSDRANIVPVYLNVKNPLRLQDMGNWTGESIADQLLQKRVLTEQQAAHLRVPTEDTASRRAQMAELRTAILKKGYDGIVYLNRREGIGDPVGQTSLAALHRESDEKFARYFPKATDSYIVLKPTQIKSAIGNRGTFDPNDPNILRKVKTDSDVTDLENLAKSADLTDIVPKVETAVEGDESGKNILLLKTPESAELARTIWAVTADTPREKAKIIEGMFLDPKQVSDFREVAEAFAEQAELAGVDAKPINDFIANLDKAAKEMGAVRLEVFEASREHETVHQASWLGGAGKGLEQRYANAKKIEADPDFQKFRKALDQRQGGKATLGVALEEALAYLASGDHAEFGLSEQEAVGILMKLVQGYADANGVAALSLFKAEKIYETIETLRQSESGKGSDASGSSVGAQRETGPETSQTQPDDTGQEKQKQRSLPGTLREAGLDAQDEAYTVFGNNDAIEAANTLIANLGLEKAIKTVEASTTYDKTHAVMSFMLQRALRNEAVKAEQSGDLEYADKLRKRGLDLASKHAELATKAGQFTQAAAMVADAVESVLYRAQKIADKRGKPLTPDEYRKFEELGIKAEDKTSDLDRLRKDIRNLKGQIKKLRDGKPRGSGIRVNRRAVAEAQKNLPDTTELIKKIKSQLRDGDEILRMVAWHGSPHTFDKFRLDDSTIGTGEGAQAYGHGLYFTDKEALADYYREALSNDEYFEGDRKLSGNEAWAAQFLTHYETGQRVPTADAIAQASETVVAGPARDEVIGFINTLADSGFTKTTGTKYKVDLKPEADEYLLWDKPLTAQSEKVRKALQAAYKTEQESVTRLEAMSKESHRGDGEKEFIQGQKRYIETRLNALKQAPPDFETFFRVNGGYAGVLSEETLREMYEEEGLGRDKQGNELYRALDKAFNSDVEASNYLKSLGIRGIKFLAGDSRAKGEGNYNYVIFDDADVEIQQILRSVPDALRPKLAQYGAAIMIDKPLSQISREGFYTQMRAQFGDKIDDILPQVYAEAFNLRMELLTKAKQDLAEAQVKAENPGKTDAEIKQILKDREAERKAKRETGALAKRLANLYDPTIAKQKQDLIDVIDDMADPVTAEYAERILTKESQAILRKDKVLYRNALEAIRDAEKVIRDEGILRKQNIVGGEKQLRDLEREEFLKRDATNTLRKEMARAYRRLEENPIKYYGKEGLKLLGESRSILASGDLSGSLRQGFYHTVTNPLLNIRGSEVLPSSFGTMLKSVFSKENYADRIKQIESHPNFDIMKQMGVEFAEAGGGLAEENIRTEYLKAVPVVKNWLAFSERTYAGFLDVQRALWAESVIEELEGQGVTFRDNPTVYKAAGDLINVATGRGNIGEGKTKAAIEAFGGVFFAPRFVVSRAQLLAHVGGGAATLPPGLRKIEMKRAARFHAAISLPMLALIALGVASVDPDDDDFLKVRIGPKARYELTGGLQQYLKLVGQIGKAFFNYADGDISGGQLKDKMWRAPTNFMMKKLAPVPSYLASAYKGKEPDTTEFNWLTGIGNRLLPISVREVGKGIYDDGVTGALLTMPTLLGVGVGYYPDRTPDSVQKEIDAISEKIKSAKGADRLKLQKELKTLKGQLKRAEKTEAGDGKKESEKGIINAVKTYAEAIGTDPLTAFNMMYKGERIRRLDNGTIVVERMSLDESSAVKRKRGSTPGMKLDHHLPLQLGGDNSDDNLELVTEAEWKKYTPVENLLGRALRLKRISKEDAQRLIKEFKAGSITAEEIKAQVSPD